MSTVHKVHVLGTALLGTLFNMYAVVLNTYIQNETGTELSFTILLTISINVRLRISAMPFWCGDPGIVYYAQMPLDSRSFLNGPGICLTSDVFP